MEQSNLGANGQQNKLESALSEAMNELR